MKKILMLLTIQFTLGISIPVMAQVKSSSVTDRIIDSTMLAKINALYEPYRKKIAASLEKNTTYQAYLKDFQNLPKITTLAEFRKAKTSFNLKYDAFKKEQFAKAGIPVKELQQKISELLPSSKYQYTFGPYMSIQLVLRAERIIPTGTSCQQFTCPFDSKLQESQGEASAAADECPVNGSTLRAVASQLLMIGSSNGLAKASAGKKINVPAGLSAVEMIAQVDYDFFASLLTYLGGGYAKTTLGFRLTGERLDEDFSLFSRELVAGVFFDYDLDLTENNFEISKSFRPLSVGGNYNIRVMAKTYSEGGGNAATAALSFINNIDFLKVCFRK